MDTPTSRKGENECLKATTIPIESEHQRMEHLRQVFSPACLTSSANLHFAQWWALNLFIYVKIE